MLNVNQLIGFGAGDSDNSVVELYRDTVGTGGGSGSSFSFTNVNIGPADPNRVVYVLVTSRSTNTNGSTNTITIGGEAATLVEAPAGFSTAAIGYAPLASGTTATIAVTFNSTVNEVVISVISLSNLENITPVDTAGIKDTADAADITTGASIDWLSGGYVMAVVGSNGSNGVTSFDSPMLTGISGPVESMAHGQGYFRPPSDSVNQTVSATLTSNGLTTTMAVVSVR